MHHYHPHPWKILVVDDDSITHLITKDTLKSFSFDHRPVILFDAYSGVEAIEVLHKEKDIALILLDVSMEKPRAGLDAVKVIRDFNREVRIVMRTGTTRARNEIISLYDVNGFEEKWILDHSSLRNVVTLGLRNYRDIQLAKNSKIEEC